jgi:hypothetical protein
MRMVYAARPPSYADEAPSDAADDLPRPVILVLDGQSIIHAES